MPNQRFTLCGQFQTMSLAPLDTAVSTGRTYDARFSSRSTIRGAAFGPSFVLMFPVAGAYQLAIYRVAI
jgi:hypothetical protein